MFLCKRRERETEREKSEKETERESYGVGKLSRGGSRSGGFWYKSGSSTSDLSELVPTGRADRSQTIASYKTSSTKTLKVGHFFGKHFFYFEHIQNNWQKSFKARYGDSVMALLVSHSTSEIRGQMHFA